MNLLNRKKVVIPFGASLLGLSLLSLSLSLTTYPARSGAQSNLAATDQRLALLGTPMDDIQRTAVAAFGQALTATALNQMAATQFDRITPTLVFPTVPPGGTTLQVANVYFHPTGLFSIDQFTGWNALTSNETTTDTYSTDPAATPDSTAVQRIGVAFISNGLGAVVQVNVERNTGTKSYTTSTDLDQVYDHTYFQKVWVEYANWTETGRSAANNQSVVNFTLTFNSRPYLGRQITALDHGWIKLIRLVVPANNPALLDSLQAALWPHFQFYAQETTVPLKWRALADPINGILVRYPSDWTASGSGTVAEPFYAVGSVGSSPYNIAMYTESKQTLQTEAAVRAYIKAHDVRATVQTVQSATLNDATGYTTSYRSTDSSGAPYSVIATLVNRNGMLHVITITVTGVTIDLLAKTGVPPGISRTISQIQGTRLLFPPDHRTMAVTVTATPTPAN